MLMIRCEVCGRQVEADEDTGEPVEHNCVDYDPDAEALPELNFDE